MTIVISVNAPVDRPALAHIFGQIALPGSAFEPPMTSFPICFLNLGGETRIVLPYDRSDIGNTDFWEMTVSHAVAALLEIPQAKL